MVSVSCHFELYNIEWVQLLMFIYLFEYYQNETL